MFEIDHLYNVLKDFKKEHVLKNIVFFRKCSEVLDRWPISESKMTTCITFLKGSDVEFDSEINESTESERFPKDWIMCIRCVSDCIRVHQMSMRCASGVHEMCIRCVSDVYQMCIRMHTKY